MHSRRSRSTGRKSRGGWPIRLGITILHGFADRDRAAGGSGHPIIAAADFLLFRNEAEARLLVHLGAVASALFIPASGNVSAAYGFEVGPGNQLLDAILFHGSRGKESVDPGGKRAVQGRCLEQLLRAPPWNTRT